MRNVERLEEPRVLKRNSDQWTRELHAAIAQAERTESKVPSKYWNRYNKEEVKERLKRMFSGLCCYCESRVGDVAYVNIEHRKPKDGFPGLTFVWTNLHLACPVCNSAKGDKWDEMNEILDAVDDNPISDHLGYEVGKTGVLCKPHTGRGATTIEHANLNRECLVQSRQEMFNCAWTTVCDIRQKERQEAASPVVRVSKENLRRMFQVEHGSLIEFAATSVLDSI